MLQNIFFFIISYSNYFSIVKKKKRKDKKKEKKRREEDTPKRRKSEKTARGPLSSGLRLLMGCAPRLTWTAATDHGELRYGVGDGQARAWTGIWLHTRRPCPKGANPAHSQRKMGVERDRNATQFSMDFAFAISALPNKAVELIGLFD